MSEQFNDPAELIFDPVDLNEPIDFRLQVASDAVKSELAQRFDLEAVAELDGEGRLELRHGLAFLKAKVTAKVTMVCAVSLETFTEGFELALETYFLPEGELPALQDDESMNEPLTDEGRADVGEFLLQSLSLALPDIPRKPGLEPMVQSFGPKFEVEEKPNPFSALADLKRPPKAQDPGEK